MEIIETLESNIADITIKGDLDANSSIDLDTYLQEQFEMDRYRFYINCKDLRYISSAGLGVFISHLDYVNQHKGMFVFYGMNNLVYETFKILGLHEVMKIAEDKDAAKKIMNEG